MSIVLFPVPIGRVLRRVIRAKGGQKRCRVLLGQRRDFAEAAADARNSMLQGWKDLGGRTALIEAVRNAFEGVLSIIKPVKEAFREIFPR